MLSKYRIINLYKRLRPKNINNVLITHDSIYIKKFPALLKIIKLKESGALEPGTRIFITRKLFKLLNKNKWNELNGQIKKRK